MKKLYLLLIMLATLTANSLVQAQAPNAFNYQAIVRDASGNIIASQLVEMRFTIRHNAAMGSIQYQETKTITTNQFGLVNHAIGTGSVTSGTFAGITWGSLTKFLQVEINTGSGFVSLGSEKLQSVPYALNSLNPGPAGPAGPQGPQGATGSQGPAGSANVNGTTNYLIKFTGTTSGGNSQIFDNGFNVGIGTTSPTDKLHVNGGSLISGGYAKFCISSDNSSGNVGIGPDLWNNVKLNINSNQDWALAVDGVAGKTGGGSWSGTSDKRLKMDILPYADGLSSILKIKPVTYHYNELSGFNTETEYVGVIAQELQEVAPYMVRSTEFKTSGIEYLNVDNSAMTYMLINAVKEQQAQIESLKKEIEILKNK